MKKHFARKSICPAKVCNLELTEEIKDIVINERVYHIPSSQLQTVTVINNDNSSTTSNNILYIESLSMREIVDMNILTNDIQLQEIDTSIDRMLSAKRTEIEKGAILLKNDYADILRQVSSSNDNPDQINLFYNGGNDTINMYDEKKWLTYSFEKGLNDIIYKLRNHFYDYYECALINKIEKVQS